VAALALLVAAAYTALVTAAGFPALALVLACAIYLTLTSLGTARRLP
jgi:hypothetical protein